MNIFEKNDKYHSDEYYMNFALKEAKKAFDKDEVPIGAVVVSPEGVILSKGHNLVEKRHCQNAHAEMLAIEKACKKINDWRLNGCSIYITLEPCSMCMSLILISRMSKVVFGLESKLFGFSLDKYREFGLYKSPILIRGGINMQESLTLLKIFFKKKRIKNSE